MSPNRTTLVGVLVTFSPTEAQKSRIKDIAAELDFLFLVDNTECESAISVDSFPSNVRVLLNGNVSGIAGALNLGVKKAIKDFGDCFIFLLDQDSSLPPSFFARQYNFAVKYGRMVVAPKYFDVNSKTFGNYTRLSKWRIYNVMGMEAVQPFEVTFAITSGTLIYSSVFEEIGFFREDFFIDHVDSEFCVRLQRADHLILVNPDVVFMHSIGSRKLRKFLGIDFKPNFHSPVRRYYAVRNGILMLREHFKIFPSLLWLIVIRIGYEYTGIIFFENFRWAKLTALFWGVIDGIFFNVGRCKRRF